MMGSNNYLGLTNDPRVKEAAIEAIRKYGSGCAGSRFLNGTLDLHVRLEERLAEFMRQEAAVTFSTGFQVNLGAIACLVSKGDTVYLDKQDHACIIDGARLSFGDVKKFKHNDPADLRRQMRNDSEAKGRLVVIDGVFSMEGDIAPLPEIVSVAREFAAGVMVDDAHGIGVLGKTGRGTAEHFDLEHDVDLIMGTFSKSMASVGGFITGNATVIDYVKHRARTLIFSAAPPPASAAAALATVEIMDQRARAPRAPLGEHAVLRGGAQVARLRHGRVAHPRRSGRRRRGSDGAPHGAPPPGRGRLRQLRPLAGDSAGAGADPHVAHGDAYAGAALPRARRVREGRPRSGAGGSGPRLSLVPTGSLSASASVVIERIGRSRADLARFFDVADALYAGDPSFVAPIRSDLAKVFQDDNPFFRHGEIQLFIARRNGKDAGRIAAILDRNHNQFHGEKAAFFGFFESENEPERGREAARGRRGLGPRAEDEPAAGTDQSHVE